MPQYVVIRLASGVVPGDGQMGSGEVFLTTQADEHTAAQFVADQLNCKTGESLYATLTTNFGTHVVSRAVT
jgi:hypothetical protein